MHRTSDKQIVRDVYDLWQRKAYMKALRAVWTLSERSDYATWHRGDWICSHDTGSSAGSVLHGQTIASGVYLRDTQNLSSSYEVSLFVCLRLCFP